MNYYKLYQNYGSLSLLFFRKNGYYSKRKREVEGKILFRMVYLKRKRSSDDKGTLIL